MISVNITESRTSIITCSNIPSGKDIDWSVSRNGRTRSPRFSIAPQAVALLLIKIRAMHCICVVIHIQLEVVLSPIAIDLVVSSLFPYSNRWDLGYYFGRQLVEWITIPKCQQILPVCVKSH